MIITKFEGVPITELEHSHYFTIESGVNEHSIKIDVVDSEVIRHSCGCKYAQITKNTKLCKHVNYSIDLLRFLGYIK